MFFMENLKNYSNRKAAALGVVQQHGHHLGACSKCTTLGPTPYMLNQNLHFNYNPK